MWEQKHDLDKCDRKTKKNNVFDSEKEAKQAASVIEAGSTKFINAFKCTVCNCWHIGSGEIKPAFQDLPVEYELTHHPPTKIGTSLADALKEYKH
jgi:hypothetical protein